MIPVNDLYKYCKIMLKDKWGYIYGTAGVKWTSARQSSVSNDMAQKYGSKWIGHMVADCSGVMVYIWRQYGLSIYHGSNTIARKYVGKLTKTPQPGYAAFKWKSTDTSKFQDGKGDFYHIGIVAEDGKTVYESRGTQTGFVTSAASSWHYFAPFNDVNYKGGSNTDMSDKKTQYLGYVNTSNGSLNIRSTPSTSGKIIGSLKKGEQVQIVDQPNDSWLEINYNGSQGYVSKKYIEKVETPKEDPIIPEPEPSPAPTSTLCYGVFIRCANEAAAKAISASTEGTVIVYYESNGEGG